jgi:hypothetical protein
MADSSCFNFEKLRSGGWFNWSLRMQMRLVEKDLWAIVSGVKERPDAGVRKQAAYNKRAQTCLAELIRHVEDSKLPHIRHYLTPPEPWHAWERLREVHEGRGWATRIQLCRKLITAQMDTTKPLQNHINFVNELAKRLASIGSPVNEEDILLSLLASLPSSYENVVVALETHHTALTVDLVTTALLNEERRQIDYAERNIPSQTETAAYASQGRNRRIADRTAKNGDKPNLAHITCYMCGKKGHYQANCPQKSAEESHAATETPEVATMSAKVETEFSDKGW